MHAKSQMQGYKYSHLVHMRTSSSISRYEIGNASEPLRVTLFYENPDRHHHQESTLTHFYVYDSEGASHKNYNNIYTYLHYYEYRLSIITIRSKKTRKSA